METQEQILKNLMNELVGEEKTKEVFQILIDKIKTNPKGIKPKLQNFKFYANLL